ncbi:Holliday junction resolvase RuvX [Candidatus Peregrinibacteria bacterium]|nr:Holliday junction resolvase RuvX [Candidatus Peregrinibacteria bacterium]
MKILALDIGHKRIGTAIGDSKIGIAFPQEILVTSDSKNNIFSEIFKMVEKNAITKILVGYPKNFSNEGDEQCERCRDFADNFEDYLQSLGKKIPVDFISEGISTQIATKKLRGIGFSEKDQRGQKDSIAAAVFLQEYLDQKIISDE